MSGSGPAYVFLLAELMEQAAIEQGIAPDLARVLARQTVAGSGALLAASPESAAELRKAVTSPGGHDRGGVEGADGAGWRAEGVQRGDRGGDTAVARTGGLKPAPLRRTECSHERTGFRPGLIAAAFQIARRHWLGAGHDRRMPRAAGFAVAEARARFPGKLALLRRFGVMLDQAALAANAGEGPMRDRLFDLLMGRFDAMKPHREGVGALLRYLPASRRRHWRLPARRAAACGGCCRRPAVPTSGLRGELRVRGLVAVWLCAMRAFARDETEDLAPTMAALDTALSRAHTAAAGWRRASGGTDGDASMAEETTGGCADRRRSVDVGQSGGFFESCSVA